jgi:hypothetical protein
MGIIARRLPADTLWHVRHYTSHGWILQRFCDVVEAPDNLNYGLLTVPVVYESAKTVLIQKYGILRVEYQ